MYVRRETLRQRKMYAKINIRLYMCICKIKMHQVSNYSRIEIIKRKIITLFDNMRSVLYSAIFEFYYADFLRI